MAEPIFERLLRCMWVYSCFFNDTMSNISDLWTLSCKTYRLNRFTTKRPKTVITSDGYTVELPWWVEESSQVLKKHDDGFELSTIIVPFTAEEVVRSIATIFSPEACVNDCRVIDFLGCESLISGRLYTVALTVEDWIQIITLRHCLEQVLGGVTIRNNTAFRGRQRMLTWNEDGSYRVFNSDHKILEALIRLGSVVKADYHSSSDRCLLNGVTYVLDWHHHLPLRHCRGRGLHVSKVDDHWEFVVTDQHQEIRIHGDSVLKKPDENRRRCFKWLFRRRYFYKAGQHMALKPERILPQLQWMTLKMKIWGYPNEQRDDFFGTVACGDLSHGLKYYPNACCYRIASCSYIWSSHLDKLGRAVVSIDEHHTIIHRYQ